MGPRADNPGQPTGGHRTSHRSPTGGHPVAMTHFVVARGGPPVANVVEKISPPVATTK